MATDINQLMFNELQAQRNSALDALVQVGAQLTQANEEKAAALERAQVAEKELEKATTKRINDQPKATTKKTKA